MLGLKSVTCFMCLYHRSFWLVSRLQQLVLFSQIQKSELFSNQVVGLKRIHKYKFIMKTLLLAQDFILERARPFSFLQTAHFFLKLTMEKKYDDHNLFFLRRIPTISQLSSFRQTIIIAPVRKNHTTSLKQMNQGFASATGVLNQQFSFPHLGLFSRACQNSPHSTSCIH